MTILIRGIPEFRMTLHPTGVGALIKLARAHYDYVCRATADDDDGLLTKWDHLVANGFCINATFRELDTCLKIMEGAGLLRSLTIAETDAVSDMRHQFHGALTVANRLSPTWTGSYP